MSRYVCIHGHFYQPPRENPWLEEIELQESAYPYHDWNERITAECYAPNTASRILNGNKRIVDIVNNYSKISFNFGPTLLSWMQTYAKDEYEAILTADQESQKIFSGHGAALAQVYNHMIMPLANTRDKHTQIIWGLRDFERRFKRKPEGMWLAETAVNTDTLEVLAEHGINFTVLAPHQAARSRKIGEEQWHKIKDGKVDTHMPYVCHLPSGKSINLFFYDGNISQEIAFGDLLKNGENLAKRLLGAFPHKENQPQLVHIATDGETYGHHQRFGDMALAFCLHRIKEEKSVDLTIYGEFLEKFPPTHEAEIVEDSSWSCVHGIERWKSDCGCCSGMKPDWHQKWREPLRNALDWLREALIPVYENRIKEFTDDPWMLRDQYIEIILNRSPENIESFFKSHAKKELSQEHRVTVLKLLEMQRHALLMYTSCGWFFDDISGIETTQIIQYAARAIQLAKEATGTDLEGEFIGLLEKAPSNIPENVNGSVVYEKFVKPATIDLLRVGAHYAVASIFEEFDQEVEVYSYTVNNKYCEKKEAGKQSVVIGRANVQSNVTYENIDFSFAVLHFGDHNINGGVRSDMGDEAFRFMQAEIKKLFLKSDIPQLINAMNKHFLTNNYSLWHLFKHEQKKIFDQIMESTLKDIEDHFRHVYEEHYPLMQARRDLNIALPKALSTTIEFVLNRDLLTVLEIDPIDIRRLKKIVEEVKRWSFEVDKSILGFMATQRINDLLSQLLDNSDDSSLLRTIEALLRLLSGLNLDLNLWKAQNIGFMIGKKYYKDKLKKSKEGDHDAAKWVNHFEKLGQLLYVQSSA